MNLKYRFALLFSFFVFIILMASLTSIYLLGEDFRKDDFAVRIRAEAVSQFAFYKKNLSKDEADVIKSEAVLPTLYDESITIYNAALQPVFSNPPDSITPLNKKLLKVAIKKGEARFKQSEKDGLVLSLKEKGIQYYVVASAYDEYGVRKMINLRDILILTLGGGLILSGLFAFFYVKQVMKPLAELNEQMKNITESNLDARVEEKRKNDELGRIARSFNSMLDRLQKAFEMQKSFVHHASHELRTPLASMLFQTEAALGKPLSTEELRTVLYSLREDQVNMSDLTNALLLLSQYESLNFSNNWVPVRIDEVLYETIETIKEAYPEAIINLDFISFTDNSNDLTIKGNEALVRTAIQNLIKNAYLYSADKKVAISIDANSKAIKIHFDNKGRHLTNEEKDRLFIPFFRGENATNIKGTGLGLSIVQRIVHLHNGTIEYAAINSSTNRFTLCIPA